jgi:hypothetical protein
MRLVLSVLLLIASTISASATAVGVPEIDAYAGLAAMAAVGSIASLLWERRRGRKH